MPKRLLALFSALLFALSGIIARLYTVMNGDYVDVAEQQSSLTITLATARGTLYDRRLERLTNRQSGYAAGVIGTPSALAALSHRTEWESLSIRLSEGKPLVLTDTQPLPLVQGIRQFTVPVRYDDSAIASHVIGTLGEDGHGVGGAERALDDILSQNSGHLTVTYQTDGTGRVIENGEVTVENTLARSGGGAALTIDRELQQAVEILLGKQLSRGAAVVMDIQTGDILALASFPTYDASAVADYLSAEDQPLFNRATAAYNCGSVFKTVTAMAALERGVPVTQSFDCVGYVQVGVNRIKCHHLLGHGSQTLFGGFAQSCNPYFIQLSALSGGNALHRYASLLGFDSPIVLMERWQTDRATLPNAEAFGSAALRANLSIGQGDLLATPVHITAMTACVANGGAYHRPNLYLGTVDQLGVLREAPRDAPSRICSEQTAQTLRAMMCAVVADGTGTAAAPAVGTAGGKTGTAQTGWTSDSGETMTHSWFTGFYPAEQPQYAVTVLAEDNGTTGENAAPLFKIVCDKLYRMGYVKIPS